MCKIMWILHRVDNSHKYLYKNKERILHEEVKKKKNLKVKIDHQENLIKWAPSWKKVPLMPKNRINKFCHITKLNDNKHENKRALQAMSCQSCLPFDHNNFSILKSFDHKISYCSFSHFF